MLNPVRLNILISNICALCAFILLSLYLTLPQDAGPEYVYTVKIMNRTGFPALLLIAIISRAFAAPFFSSLSRQWKIMAIVGAVLLLIPFIAPPAGLLSWRMGYMLSVCWIAGTLCAAIVLFAVAARVKSAFSGALCLAGSLALAFSCMEGYLLLTPQTQDALLDDSRHSKYVLSHQAAIQGANLYGSAVGTFPKASGIPVFEAQRTLKFDHELFDVRYGFDAQGRRVTPPSDAKPLAELLLFGCSYTFGAGLEDTETWAWQLSRQLGPAWRLSNYAYNGFGPHQMLTLLEEGMVESPSAPERAALFLAIGHQIRRNAGLVYRHNVRYALREDGRLERDGFTSDSPYTVLFLLPNYFNGSQLVRHISIGITEFFANHYHSEFTKTYVAILEKASRLLREKYNASLTVLLWPDVEYLESELQQCGIATLRARAMLPDWDSTRGEVYFIDPKWERHPNARAARELAEGLAAYFRPLLLREKQQ